MQCEDFLAMQESFAMHDNDCGCLDKSPDTQCFTRAFESNESEKNEGKNEGKNDRNAEDEEHEEREEEEQEEQEQARK
jgi:hypothetical protein